MEDHFLIAEIASVFNDDGYVKVKSFSDFPERFFHLEEVYINVFGDLRSFFIEDVNELGKFFTLKFKNFNSESDVEFLVGSSIFVNKTDSVTLDEDTFFIHDLIECKVFFEDKFYGSVVDVLSLNSSDIYVVNDDKGHERLIPAVSDFIESVNVDEKKIILKIDFDMLSDDEN